MKKSPVTFDQLRRLLLDLQFTEEAGIHWRFEHPASGAIFLFRPYTLDEHINMADLAGTRMHLDWRGLLPEKMFDDLLLTKTPA